MTCEVMAGTRAERAYRPCCELQVLAGHEPYPAVVVDRAWNLVDANASVAVLLGQADPELLAPRAGRAVRRAPGLSRRPPQPEVEAPAPATWSSRCGCATTTGSCRTS